VVSVQVDRARATEFDDVIVTAVVVDDNGAADVVGGVVVDADVPATTLPLSSLVPGTFTRRLTRADFQALRPVDFVSSASRTLRLRFVDGAGLVAEGTVVVTLGCSSGGPACDGVCGQARCGAACIVDDPDIAGDGCGCPDVTAPDVCGAVCVSLASDVNHCGACNRACASSSTCGPHALHPASACGCAVDGDCGAGVCAFGGCATATSVVFAGGSVVAFVDGTPTVFCTLGATASARFCADLGLGAPVAAPPGTTPSLPGLGFADVLGCAGPGSLWGCAVTSTQPCEPAGVSCLANGSGQPAEIDFCDVPSAAASLLVTGAEVATLTARVREAAVTDGSAAAPRLRAEFGFRAGTDPGIFDDYVFVPAALVDASGADDRYAVTVRRADGFDGPYRYLARFSVDDGLSWTLCDADGAGAAAGTPFTPGLVGLVTTQP
jgi:hypothetical protein